MHTTLKEKTHSFLTDRLADQLSVDQLSKGLTFFCTHIGPSMNPTLMAQDILEIKPFENEVPRAGDVILFTPPENNHYIVHRITSITADGIKTRGDNNSNSDPGLLKIEDVFGRVITIQRGSSRRKVANGFWGKWVGKYCHIRRLAIYKAVKYLGPLYRSLCSGGILHWLVPVRLTPQVATFKFKTDDSHKLLLGNRIIGSYDESRLQWQIKRPYRLFVNESSLPKP